MSLDAKVTVFGQETSVKEVLLKKHPPSQPPKPSTIVSPSISSPPFHPVVFEGPDRVLIRLTILRMDGAAGPSGLDVAAWKKLCTSFRGA